MTRDDRLERRPGRFRVVHGRKPLEQLTITQSADRPDPKEPFEMPGGLDPSSAHGPPPGPWPAPPLYRRTARPLGATHSSYGVFPGLTLAAILRFFRRILPKLPKSPARYFSITKGFG